MKIINKRYIGKEKWTFSDNIYFKLTGQQIKSNFNPEIFINVIEVPNVLKNKKLYILFWNTPTFKDVDCNYLFHVYDKKDIDYIISTSSANTVEGVARVVKNYNEFSGKKIRAILLVPELSSYKVDKYFIDNNQYVKLVVLENSTLDSIRYFADRFKEKMDKKYNTVMANTDLKTAAYAQIGFILNELNLLDNDCCFIQTVSGGVGPVGVIESAYKLNLNPEILVIQPEDGNTAPIVDALNEYKSGKDPIKLLNEVKFGTPPIETTLGSTKPIYAIKKFIKWKENGGRIFASKVNSAHISQYKDYLMKTLIKSKIYENISIGEHLYKFEKSGFIALIGAIIYENKIDSKNVIVNFTGRRLPKNAPLPETATQFIKFDINDNLSKLIDKLGL